MEGSSTDNHRTREIVAVADYPAYIRQIADYICQIDQPPRQVLIEVHILQIDLNDECRNGVNLEQITSFQGNQVRFLNAGFANPAAATASFLEVDGTGLNGLLEILQTTTDAKTLASPRVLALSGQEARIQIGDQLGYRITTTTHARQPVPLGPLLLQNIPAIDATTRAGSPLVRCSKMTRTPGSARWLFCSRPPLYW